LVTEHASDADCDGSNDAPREAQAGHWAATGGAGSAAAAPGGGREGL